MTARSLAQLRDLQRKTAIVLRIEQYWHRLNWLLLIPILWGAASLLHIPQSLPDTLHLIIELAGFFGIIWALWNIPRTLPSPSAQLIDQRIEKDSHLSFHPLTTLADTPALQEHSPSSLYQKELWEAHRARTLFTLTELHVYGPHFFQNRKTKITTLLITVLYALLLCLSGEHALTRLKAGFIPGTDDDYTPLPSLHAWIDFPDYAVAPPIFLESQTPHTLNVPQGAHIHAVINDSESSPSLKGVTIFEKKSLSPHNWQVDGTLLKSSTVLLSVRGRTLGNWPVTVSPDHPTTIQWTGTPKSPHRDGHILFPWKASQEHGIDSLDVILTPVLPPHNLPDTIHSIRLNLPLRQHPTAASETTSLDLTDSPLAGLNVEAHIHARSISGLESDSPNISFALQGRIFHDALSRALLRMRQDITLQRTSLSRVHEELSLLTQLPLSYDLKLALTSLYARTTHHSSLSALSSQLWFLALYSEDRFLSGPDVAASMAHIHSAQYDAKLHILHMQEMNPPTPEEQEYLHKNLEELKDALAYHMKLVFQTAQQNGIVMPLPDKKGMPWSPLAEHVQTHALQGHTHLALESLDAMVDMAEQMRQATPLDMQSLIQSMKAQAEARSQRAAMRDLIKQETSLLNRTQVRLSSELPQTEEKLDHRDINQMSTTDLLRQLGMEPIDTPPSNSLDPSSLDPNIILKNADARQHDYAVQQALSILTSALIHRGEELTHKPSTNLQKAQHDMSTALHDLASRHDQNTPHIIQTILNDLSQARQEMQKNQKSAQGNSKGHLGFIPPPPSHQKNTPDQNNNGASQPQSQDLDVPDDGDDDTDQDQNPQAKNQDPLGRKMDDSPDSDAHIPDQDHNQAHDIERELERRASDRTRPQSELDYLNRLLAPFKNTH